MRAQFVLHMQQMLSEKSHRILVTGDLGFGSFESIQQAYPKQFLNAGVAEQNMISVSAGMALRGLEPWVYSITPFLVYRPFEIIRNCLALHRLPVRLVGNGGGYTYGMMGTTHHGLEDLGALKLLPNFELFFPGQDAHVVQAMKLMSESQNPSYLRLAVSGYTSSSPALATCPETLASVFHVGTGRFAVVGIGHALQTVLRAKEAGAISEDVSIFGLARYPFVVSNHASWSSLVAAERVVVVDEHRRAGSIAESLASSLLSGAKVQICAVDESSAIGSGYGSSQFHQNKAGLSPEGIGVLVREFFGP